MLDEWPELLKGDVLVHELLVDLYVSDFVLIQIFWFLLFQIVLLILIVILFINVISWHTIHIGLSEFINEISP